MATIATDTVHHRIVSHQDWIAARKEFLKKEKEFTRQRDEISRLRRELPWEKVEKLYEFEGPAGKVPLAGLFGNAASSSSITSCSAGLERGCPSCSYLADHSTR